MPQGGNENWLKGGNLQRKRNKLKALHPLQPGSLGAAPAMHLWSLQNVPQGGGDGRAAREQGSRNVKTKLASRGCSVLGTWARQEWDVGVRRVRPLTEAPREGGWSC